MAAGELSDIILYELKDFRKQLIRAETPANCNALLAKLNEIRQKSLPLREINHYYYNYQLIYMLSSIENTIRYYIDAPSPALKTNLIGLGTNLLAGYGNAFNKQQYAN
jgi:hypothetical protein